MNKSQTPCNAISIPDHSELLASSRNDKEKYIETLPVDRDDCAAKCPPLRD